MAVHPVSCCRCIFMSCVYREPGKPLFVSLLVYLDKHWPRENDAETLFLDSPTDTGIGCGWFTRAVSATEESSSAGQESSAGVHSSSASGVDRLFVLDSTCTCYLRMLQLSLEMALSHLPPPNTHTHTWLALAHMQVSLCGPSPTGLC